MDPYQSAPGARGAAPPPGYGYGPGYGQGYGYEQQQAAIYAKDQQDIRVLAILHFVYAGFVGLTAAIFGVYMLVGAAFLASSAAGVSSSAPKAGEAAMVGTVLFIVFGSVVVFLFLKAALLVYSGLSLRKQERKLLSQIVAGLACINVPFGTALGVYTFTVLGRPSVTLLYAQNRSQ